MIVYHKELGFPVSHPRPQIGLPFIYSRHAIFKADRDNIQHLPVSLPPYELIEIYFNAHDLVKYVVRFKHLKAQDLVMVVAPDGFVLTLWLNACTDDHRTLDRSRYTIPTGGQHGLTEATDSRQTSR